MFKSTVKFVQQMKKRVYLKFSDERMKIYIYQNKIIEIPLIYKNYY